jgi:hypothetical protein
MPFLQTHLSLVGRISTDTLNRIITALATNWIDDSGVFLAKTANAAHALICSAPL